MMTGNYDVHFFEIGKECGTDFAIFVSTSMISNMSEADARTKIDEAVDACCIPSSAAYRYAHTDGGRLDIDTNSQSNVICVFYLRPETESYFKDNKPILNLKVHRTPDTGYVSGSNSYPQGATKPKWASFKIDRERYRPANSQQDTDIVTVPFVLNIMNIDTECWPSMGHHHKHGYFPKSHGGIHPDTPANIVRFS